MCIIKKEIEESGVPCSGLEREKECEKCSCCKENKEIAELKAAEK